MAPVAYQAGKGRWEGAAAVAARAGQGSRTMELARLWAADTVAPWPWDTELPLRLPAAAQGQALGRAQVRAELREAKAETGLELLHPQPGVTARDMLQDMAPVPGMGESQLQGQPWWWALPPTELDCGSAALSQPCHP